MLNHLRVKSMYWLYNILLLMYWASLIPVDRKSVV